MNDKSSTRMIGTKEENWNTRSNTTNEKIPRSKAYADSHKLHKVELATKRTKLLMSPEFNN